MKHVRKSVLLWYSAQEMYDLVVDIPRYPKFLPWCHSAEVLQAHDDGVTARVGLHYAGVRHDFTTRNVQVPGDSVLVKLVDGPFSVLDGRWTFTALQHPDEEEGKACKVLLDLSYAFSSKALEAVLSPVFDRVANTLVDSFVARAEQVHGPR